MIRVERDELAGLLNDKQKRGELKLMVLSFHDSNGIETDNGGCEIRSAIKKVIASKERSFLIRRRSKSFYHLPRIKMAAPT